MSFHCLQSFSSADESKVLLIKSLTFGTDQVKLNVKDGAETDSPVLFNSDLVQLSDSPSFPPLVTTSNSITVRLSGSSRYDRDLYFEIVSLDRGIIQSSFKTGFYLTP